MNVIKHDLNNRNDVDRIIKMLYPDVPKHVSEMMLEYCRALGLDPFAKPMFAMKTVDSKTRHEKYTIGYTIGFFRIMAQRTGEYGGCDAPVYDVVDGKLVSCAMTVYRYKIIGGTPVRVPCTHKLFEREFIKKTNGGYGIGDKMPYHMLSIRCEAAVLRKLFPEVLSSHYIKEELDSEEAVSGDFSVVSPPVIVDTSNRVEDQPFGVDWTAPKESSSDRHVVSQQVDELFGLLADSSPSTQKWVEENYPGGILSLPIPVAERLIDRVRRANARYAQQEADFLLNLEDEAKDGQAGVGGRQEIDSDIP